MRRKWPSESGHYLILIHPNPSDTGLRLRSSQRSHADETLRSPIGASFEGNFISKNMGIKPIAGRSCLRVTVFPKLYNTPVAQFLLSLTSAYLDHYNWRTSFTNWISTKSLRNDDMQWFFAVAAFPIPAHSKELCKRGCRKDLFGAIPLPEE